MQQPDLYNLQTVPAVPLRKDTGWNAAFCSRTDPGNSELLRTKDNLLHIRIFDEDAEIKVFELFASPEENLLFPKMNWIRILTNLGNTSCGSVRNEEYCLQTNSQPFVVSGLYDWSRYIFIAHAGSASYEPEEQIDENFFSSGEWAKTKFRMCQEDPFTVLHRIESKYLRKKKLKAEIQPAERFNVSFVTGKIWNLDEHSENSTFYFNGLGTPIIKDTMTICLDLKENCEIPDNIYIKVSENKE